MYTFFSYLLQIVSCGCLSWLSEYESLPNKANRKKVKNFFCLQKTYAQGTAKLEITFFIAFLGSSVIYFISSRIVLDFLIGQLRSFILSIIWDPFFADLFFSQSVPFVLQIFHNIKFGANFTNVLYAAFAPTALRQ